MFHKNSNMQKQCQIDEVYEYEKKSFWAGIEYFLFISKHGKSPFSLLLFTIIHKVLGYFLRNTTNLNKMHKVSEGSCKAIVLVAVNRHHGKHNIYEKTFNWKFAQSFRG